MDLNNYEFEGQLGPLRIPTPDPNDFEGSEDPSIVSTVKAEEVHSCDMCRRTFLNKKDFLLHQYNHKEKSSFYCAYCFKTFTSEFSFKKHNKIHEKKKTRSVLCTICSQKFEYVKDLEEHHRKFHLGQKLFSCERCDATFSWRENLNKHMRMHATPQVIHKCDQCTRTFMDNTSLRLHVCVKSKTTSKPDKPFICKLCDKAFQFDFSFQAHMNSHEGPVAISAWKNVQKKKMEKKSMEVNKAAERQLERVKAMKDTPREGEQGVDKAPSSQETTNIVPQTSQVRENLKEIVLEIVNVNELPKGESPEGAQILAQGPNPDPDQPLAQHSQNTCGLVARIDLNSSVEESMESPVLPEQSTFLPIQVLNQSGLNNMHELTAPSLDPIELTPVTLTPLGPVDPATLQTVQEMPQHQLQPTLTPVEEDSSPLKQEEPEASTEPEEAEHSPPPPPPPPPQDEPYPKINLFSAVSTETVPEEENLENQGKSKKKSKRPLLYDYVMTEETPFQCPQCHKEFRWEISLNIHLQEHMDGHTSNRNSRNKKPKKHSLGFSPQTSKIVHRRASSDEEEDDMEHPDFQYDHVRLKRKRGRPRKYPLPDSNAPPKRRRGRPPKYQNTSQDPIINHLENTNETVIIRVTKGAGGTHYQIKKERDPGSKPSEEEKEPTQAAVPPAESSPVMEDIHIPRHQLVRFYLLRQLKLSRYRGFYPCRFCSKPFSCKASLNMHILRHTGKGSYLCSHCEQKFPDHRTLVLHRLIEEMDEDDAAVNQCSTCCRPCSSAENLVKHIRRHLPTAWPSSRPRVKLT